VQSPEKILGDREMMGKEINGSIAPTCGLIFGDALMQLDPIGKKGVLS
jgi:hypothetical protein